MDKFEKILDIIDHQEKYSDEEIREILQDEECRKLYQTMMEVDSALENPSPIINVDEEWEKFSQEHQLQEEATQNAAQEAASHPITSWRKLAASIARFCLDFGYCLCRNPYLHQAQSGTNSGNRGHSSGSHKIRFRKAGSSNGFPDSSETRKASHSQDFRECGFRADDFRDCFLL